MMNHIAFTLFTAREIGSKNNDCASAKRLVLNIWSVASVAEIQSLIGGYIEPRSTWPRDEEDICSLYCGTRVSNVYVVATILVSGKRRVAHRIVDVDTSSADTRTLACARRLKPRQAHRRTTRVSRRDNQGCMPVFKPKLRWRIVATRWECCGRLRRPRRPLGWQRILSITSRLLYASTISLLRSLIVLSSLSILLRCCR
jgi:hypothetical protein